MENLRNKTKKHANNLSLQETTNQPHIANEANVDVFASNQLVIEVQKGVWLRD